MKNLKNQKGITLVALVVTIIVLLILAGVSLSLVAGSNGIITKASNATDQNSIATAKEQVTMMIAEWTTEYYEDVYVNETSAYGADVNTKVGNWIAKNKIKTDTKATTDGYKFTISDPNDETDHIITIQKGNELPRVITVTLTQDGKLENWSE